MKVKIDGLDKLSKKLDKLSSIEAEKALKEGLVDGALDVVQEAKRRVPVQTGDLKANLHIGGYTKLTPDYRKVGVYGSLREYKGKGKSFGVLVGSTLPYAHLVELGTKRARPKPFLRPAADAKQKDVIKKVEKGIQNVIDER